MVKDEQFSPEKCRKLSYLKMRKLKKEIREAEIPFTKNNGSLKNTQSTTAKNAAFNLSSVN